MVGDRRGKGEGDMGLIKRAKVPRMTRAHYWWIIQELGVWFKAGGSNFDTFLFALADSLADTNKLFNRETFIEAAKKHYAA
jgi:hypothetical protein